MRQPDTVACSFPMFDQTRIVTELLHLMIAGEHPVDLKVSRFCAAKLHCQATADRIEMLDQAQLFHAPARFVDGLRRDALRAIDRAVSTQD